MLQLNRVLGVGFLVRGMIRELSGIKSALEQQNQVLLRLADRLAPSLPPTASEADLARHTGVAYLDEREAVIVLDYIGTCERDTGHTPSVEEILTYLADEATQSLAARMHEREQLLEAKSSRGGDPGSEAW